MKMTKHKQHCTINNSKKQDYNIICRLFLINNTIGALEITKILIKKYRHIIQYEGFLSLFNMKLRKSHKITITSIIFLAEFIGVIHVIRELIKII